MCSSEFAFNSPVHGYRSDNLRHHQQPQNRTTVWQSKVGLWHHSVDELALAAPVFRHQRHAVLRMCSLVLDVPYDPTLGNVQPARKK